MEGCEDLRPFRFCFPETGGPEARLLGLLLRQKKISLKTKIFFVLSRKGEWLSITILSSWSQTKKERDGQKNTYAKVLIGPL